MTGAGAVTVARPPEGLLLESGARLDTVTIAYECWGNLNRDRSNAILICHPFTADAHATSGRQPGPPPDGSRPGWWEEAIGPGKPFDTDRYFVICSNVLGGCAGSTGPASLDPSTGRPFGMRFPVVTVRDMVQAQIRLIDWFGIDRLLAVAGGSLGGMQALRWAVDFPERVAACIPIAACARSSAQSIALNEAGRQAVYADTNWKKGDYYDSIPPDGGLAVARMIGHISYMSDTSMRSKFGRRLQGGDRPGYTFDTDFAVESYLRHRGASFPGRFDANSYLYVSKAIDYFDLTAGRHSLEDSLKEVAARVLVIGFSSDWLFPAYQSREVVRALLANNVAVTSVVVESVYGHDAFLVEVDRMAPFIGDFLTRTWRTEAGGRRDGLPGPRGL